MSGLLQYLARTNACYILVFIMQLTFMLFIHALHKSLASRLVGSCTCEKGTKINVIKLPFNSLEGDMF